MTEPFQFTRFISSKTAIDFVKHFGFRLFLASLLVPLFHAAALAAPEGAQVVGGQADITQANASTVIHQYSDLLAIDWQGFNLESHETVSFQQPSASSIALNRIFDQNPTQIFGAIEANGRVFLSNPNGMVFGPSATIHVGSFVGSGLDINVVDFMEGRYNFSASDGQAGGIVINRGLIAAATGGSVSLIGGAVSNDGVILANRGHVNLGAGRKSVITFDAEGLIQFEISEALLKNEGDVTAAVNNSGQITADGGEVLLTATAAQDVFKYVVNNDGIIEAGRIDNSGGVVRLVGIGSDPVIHAGMIDVSGQDTVSTGGTVHVLGEKVGLFGEAAINASGKVGGGTVLIGGDFQGKGLIPNAKVTYFAETAAIKADAVTAGDGGKVIVWSDETSRVYGEISTRGGLISGDGGLVETSSKGYLEVTRAPDIGAGTGYGGWWLIDPSNIEIIDTDLNIDQKSDVPNPGDIRFQSNKNAASTINVATLVAAINVASVDSTIEVSTSDGSTTTGDAGTITLSSALNFDPSNTGVTLLFSADSDITMDASVTPDTNATLNNVLNFTLAAGGNVDINAPIDTNGGDFHSSGVNLVNTDGITSTGSITTGTGDVIINHTGTVTVGADITSGGTIDITANTLTVNQAVNSGGDINLSADKMALNAAVNTGTGIVTLKPMNAGDAINLGSIGSAAANTLELSDLELDQITATTLRIGDANTGQITVSTGISPANISNLSLLSDEGIGNTNAGNITLAGGLRLDVDTAIDLSSGNNVDTLAVNISNENALVFADNDGLIIGVVDGSSGVTTNNGQINITAVGNDNTLTVSQAVNSGGGGINLSADKMALNAAVNTGTGIVTLISVNAADKIDLGSSTNTAANTLELSDLELDQITATTLRIGDANTGQITVSAGISPANISNLSLLSDEGIGNTNVGNITLEGGLRLDVDTAIDLSSGNNVDTLAVNISNENALVFADNDGLIIGVVDGSSGVTTNNGQINITAAGNDNTLTVSQAVNSGGGDINLSADKMALNAAVNTGTGIVTLTPANAGDAINLGSTGSTAANTLELSDLELKTIAAATLKVVAAGITVSDSIDLKNTDSLIIAGSASVKGNITTVGNLELQGVVSLSKDVTFTSNKGAILIADKVDSSTTTGAGLTLQALAGNVALAGIGTTNPLSDLTIKSNTNTLSGDIVTTGIKGINLTAAGNIILSTQLGTITLSSKISTNNSVTGGLIRLDGSAINSDLNLNTGLNIVVATDGEVFLADTMGKTIPLKFLSISTSIKTLHFGESIRVTNDLHLNSVDPVTLDKNLTLTTEGSGEINLANVKINGPFSLDIFSGGGMVSLGSIGTGTSGSPNPLRSLSVDNAGKTVLGGNIITNGPRGLNFTKALDVEITNDVTITADGDVHLDGGKVDGVSILSINAGIGEVTLGEMGKDKSFASLTINGGSIIQNGNITTKGDVKLTSNRNITMSEKAVTKSNGHAIIYTSETGDVLIGQLDAGIANVTVDTTGGGSILNSQPEFFDLKGSRPGPVNIKGEIVVLRAKDRIGESISDAIAIEVPKTGNIALTFGAKEAFIRNINAAPICCGRIVNGLVESRVAKQRSESAVQQIFLPQETPAMTEEDHTLVTVMSPGFGTATEMGTAREISSLDPVVPDMVRTPRGWRFVRKGSPQEKSQGREAHDKEISNKFKEGFKYSIDPFSSKTR